MSKASELRIYVRAHTRLRDTKRRKRSRGARKRRNLPLHSILISCQAPGPGDDSGVIGAFQVMKGWRTIKVGLICADSATEEELDSIADRLRAVRIPGLPPRMRRGALRREKFVKKVFRPAVVDLRALVVGFNLPVDLSRLSVSWSEARTGPFKGGFSLCLRDYLDSQGRRRNDGFTPRVAVKAIDGARALIGRTSDWRKRETQPTDHGEGYSPDRGQFLDLRTLTLALMGDDLELGENWDRFGPETIDGPQNGSPEDPVEVPMWRLGRLGELFPILTGLYRRIGTLLPPEEAYSAASVGKELLREAGVKVPPLKIRSSRGLSTDDVDGWAMSAYYGGRAECRIRRVPVPVVYCDFKSMYPTIMANMGLWELTTAREIAVEDATEETRRLLEVATAEDLLKPECWKQLTVLAEIEPQDDLLPVRCEYGAATHGHPSIGLNYVTSPFPLVYTLADCLASKLATRKSPRVLRAIRFRPVGQQRLRKVSICGLPTIDPSEEDLYRWLVEARYRVGCFGAPYPITGTLESFLKVMANSIGYGIFVELLRREDEPSEVDVYCLGDAFRTVVTSPEEPGPFYMPVLATLISGGARLMLALAEDQVARLGGTYAFMDTDSIAVVATQEGGLVPCPGGRIRALSWEQVEHVRRNLSGLNPYNRELVPGSILDLEPENFSKDDSRRGEREQLWCYCIISKRYVLYNLEGGLVRIRKGSGHTFGSYCPPVDPGTGLPVEDWIDECWELILQKEVQVLEQRHPAWLRQLAVRTLRLSRPWMMPWFGGKEVHPYELVEHVVPNPLALKPKSPDGRPVCLIRRATAAGTVSSAWTDMHDANGPIFRVVAGPRETIDHRVVLGETYGDLVEQHPLRPEPKSSDRMGEPCARHTKGMLGPRHIFVREVVAIGKEANEIELLGAGIVDDEEGYLTKYPRDIRDILPEILRIIPAKIIQQQLKCSRRYSYCLRNGERRPSKKLLQQVTRIAGDFARKYLTEHNEPNIPAEDELAIIRLANTLRKSADSIRK